MMKWYHGIWMMVLTGCSSSVATKDEQADTLPIVINADSTERIIHEAELVNDEPPPDEAYEEERTSLDSAWFTDFARDPLGVNSYDGIKDYLAGKGVQVRDTVIGGEKALAFCHSWVSLNVNDTYGDLVCSAVIDTSVFSLSKGVEIGMMREDFMQMTGMSHEDVTPDPAGGVYFNFDISYEDGTSTSSTFYFNDKQLIKVSYSYSPCIIYD
jgi:hypothetical protein